MPRATSINCRKYRRFSRTCAWFPHSKRATWATPKKRAPRLKKMRGQAENAIIKARAAAEALNLPALADDSGLCVAALGGAPGIYSARYAGGHGDDKKNREKLLAELGDEKNRAAYFRSAAALCFPQSMGGKTVTATGDTHGRILTREEGENGFGYDCLFYSDDLCKSFGVASAEEKNAVSHRFRALTALKEKLKSEDEKQ